MAKQNDTDIVWRDRKHHLWFPISFTAYKISKDRLYTETGFFTSHYDELLLYRIVDVKLTRTLLHKIFGTGNLTLCTKVDTDREIILENIKDPLATKELISNLVEEIRDRKRVVGKEFFGGPGGAPRADFDVEDYEDMNDGEGEGE